MTSQIIMAFDPVCRASLTSSSHLSRNQVRHKSSKMIRNTPKRNLSSSSTKDSEKNSKISVTLNRYASLSEDADSPPEVFCPPPVKLAFQDQLNIPPANMESPSPTKVQTPPFYVSEG
ncbi:hypothetical protein QTP88_018069 [Uroleucon formosanum]